MAQNGSLFGELTSAEQALQNALRTDGSPWKVLVLDEFCKKVVARLMTVGKLRACGITMTLDLKANRQKIQHSTVVYFIQPSLDNFTIVLNDIKNENYLNYYIEFPVKVDDKVLENFALSLRNLKQHAKFNICRVYERFLSIIVEKQNAFSLGIRNCTIDLYFRQASDDVLTGIVGSIKERMFAFCLLNKFLPNIIYPESGTPASAIALALKDQFQAELSHNVSFLNQNSSQLTHPHLLIVDRITDLPFVLAYHWEYDQLILDLLDRENNFVKVNNVEYDLSDMTDDLFKDFADKLFPEVAGESARLLHEFSARMISFNDAQKNKMSEDVAESMNFALHGATKFRKEKTDLDKHASICAELVKKIDEKQIDVVVSICNNLLVDKEISVEFFNQIKQLNYHDTTYLLRLCFLAEIFSVDTNDMNDLYRQLFNGIPNEINVLRKLLSDYKQYNIFLANNSEASATKNNRRLFDNVVEKGKNLLKNIVSPGQNLNIFQLLNNYFVKGQLTKNYNVYRPTDNNPSNTVIVFIVGMGSYCELTQLKQWFTKMQLNFIYACTAFENADTIIDNL